MDLSDLFIRYLELFEIDYVFGIPGGAISPLYDALARSERRGGPRAIVARQESGAAFMADGYARETGKIGVCCATTGPGATNMITGIAAACAEDIPILAVTAQTALPNFGRGAFQESSTDAIDTVAMFRNCTRYSTVISHPGQFETKLATALSMALSPPQGPVHLSVPLDVFRSPANEQITSPKLAQLLVEPTRVDIVAVDKLCQELDNVLNNNHKAIIMVGYNNGNADQEIVEFAELIGADIVTTPSGKSCGIDSYHPLMQGVIGFAGHDSAFKALIDDSVGLILAVGATLDEWSTGSWDADVLMNDRLVHIHTSDFYFSRSPMARLHVCGNLKTIFQHLKTHVQTTRIGRKLLKQITLNKPKYEIKRSSSARRLELQQSCAPNHVEINVPEFYRRERNISIPIKPQRLMCEISQRFPPKTRFLADTGNSFAWAIHYFFSTKGSICRFSMGFAAMGWAIGASIGTSLGRKSEGPVVCITGNGSYLMNGQEITVAVARKMTVIFVILNDHGLGMVKHGQHLTGSESIGHQIAPTNFYEMAKTMGADGYLIQDINDFNKIDIDTITAANYGPTILDVRVDVNEIPPMGMRVKALRRTKSYSFTDLKRRVDDMEKEQTNTD